MKNSNLILTCSLCSNFDSVRGLCKIQGQKRDAESQEFASDCNRRGNFVRYIHVIPDRNNYFLSNESTPIDWVQDRSKLPSYNGMELYVRTNRGIERPIPANESVDLLRYTDGILGIGRIYTYQGQRELIYQLGVDLAREEARRRGIELTVLPGEENFKGLPQYQVAYLREKKGRENHKPKCLIRPEGEEW